ncbi:serine/threonine-protein kinase [Methanoregula sp.]|uniref:serine/threonine-protein kinase n=1 Tax=Methanoregula sp. TaxID=2052170 RepID=UPI0035636FB4
MSRTYTGLVIVGTVVLIAVIAGAVFLGVAYDLVPWILQNRIPVLIACAILAVVYLVVSGKIGSLRKKYRDVQLEDRKARIKNGINTISKQVHAHPDHVNAEEAIRLTYESYRYLDSGDFKKAIESIKKARELVEVTADRVSARAKALEVRAEAQFKAKKYTSAQKLWNQSLAIYADAEKIAQHAKDNELIAKIAKTKEAIQKQVIVCEVALDRQELAKSTEAGDLKVASADKKFRAQKFDEARNNYEGAKEHFARALAFADKKGLTGDQPGIHDRIARVDAGLVSVILGKTRGLISEAAGCSEKRNFVVAENYHALAIRFLEENPVTSSDATSLMKDAQMGLVTARLEQGKEKMRNADTLYAKMRYLEAKKEYESAKDYLKETGEIALRYNLSTLHALLVRLGETCTENSEVAAAMFMDASLLSPPIVPVDSLEQGQQPAPARLARTPPVLPAARPAQRTSIDTLPPELAAIYPEWTYLGKGGFARVFKARRTDGKNVAVKIPLYLDTRTGKTFIAEMQTWKKLNHPNIVKLYDFNIMPMPYLEEELCDSRLEDIKKPADPEEAAWILFNICEGLKFAHAQKIVHRDLKPGNILLKEGVPKISDWGLSRILTEMTTATSMAFTLTYAAPEQIHGGMKDERTDIWQLGVILYELLTGTLPFDGENMMSIRKSIATKDPKLPGDIIPDAKVLDPVVMKCLAKEPKNRYPSVLLLQNALAEFLRITYTESLKLSTSEGDQSRSAYLTGALVLTHLRTGDPATAHTYLLDLIHYAEGDVKDEAVDLSEQLRNRIEFGITEIPDELLQKADIIVRSVGPGAVARK